MDVCISPNTAFVFSGVTSLKLIPVQSDKTEEKNLSHNKNCVPRRPVHAPSFIACYLDTHVSACGQQDKKARDNAWTIH